MSRVRITYEPAVVDVADARCAVLGAAVTVTEPDGTVHRGDIIPPEGDHPSCWLGGLYSVACDLDIVDTLDYAAQRGSRGESGCEEVAP